MKTWIAGSRWACLLSLLLAQPTAFAYDYTYTEDPEIDGKTKFYVGAGLGFLAGDANELCSVEDLNCTTWKTFVGYQPFEQVALEGGYHHHFAGRAQSDGAKFDASGLSLSVLGMMPVKDNIEAFGRLGLSAWEARENGRGVSNGTDVLLGGGAQMRMTDNLGVRGEIEYIGGDLNSTNLSAGVTYSTF